MISSTYICIDKRKSERDKEREWLRNIVTEYKRIENRTFLVVQLLLLHRAHCRPSPRQENTPGTKRCRTGKLTLSRPQSVACSGCLVKLVSHFFYFPRFPVSMYINYFSFFFLFSFFLFVFRGTSKSISEELFTLLLQSIHFRIEIRQKGIN